MNDLSIVEKVNKEINTELSNEAVGRALLATTFKGLDAKLMKQALLEGMIRGFTFQDFLKKDVYALPYNSKAGLTYSIVTSIDLSRKIAARTGQFFGKTTPIFEYGDDGKSIVSCEVTVKKLIDHQVGEFSAKVYFSEYKGQGPLWTSKPRTMLAKVAEMHALRMAFPEEMAKQYIEEEFEKDGPTKEDVGLLPEGPATAPAPHTTTPASHVVTKPNKHKVDKPLEDKPTTPYNEEDEETQD